MAIGTAAAILGSAVIGAAASSSASKRAAAAMKGSSDAAALQAQIGAEQWDRYQEIYDPLERQLVQDAREFDSPAAYERAAGEASATVASQFGKARDRLTRTPGLDSSSPAFAAGMVGLDLSQAAMDATQQNAARFRVKDTAWARKQDAMSLGKGLPSSASSMLSSAASTMGNIGANQYNLAQAQAGQVGRIADRVLSSPGMNSWLNTTPSSAVRSEVAGLGSNTWNPMSDYNTGANGWGNYGE